MTATVIVVILFGLAIVAAIVAVSMLIMKFVRNRHDAEGAPKGPAAPRSHEDTL
ncbi:hypothetical protein [Actinoplanes utahensis]|uniref:hypothetical protein n=1 Tax=Actinoplanes utahensis TaxID=1869 RepID=UPI00137733A9|nr:hypothetical protein [Actinoplanes utahensis]